jgi:hypothetical protein
LNQVDPVLSGRLIYFPQDTLRIWFNAQCHEESSTRLSTAADATRERLEVWAAQLKREIERLVDHLAERIGDPLVIGLRSTEPHYEYAEAMREQAEAVTICRHFLERGTIQTA